MASRSTRSGARRLIRSGIDEVTFSLDGASQETFVIYRQRGDFDKAIRNLRAAVEEKRARGQDVPFINWRYILFSHNDSDAEMNRARATPRRSESIASAGRSRTTRRTCSRNGSAPGTPDYDRIRHEIWDNSGLGNAIPGATPRARIDVRTLLPGPLRARAGSSLRVRTRVHNLSTRPFPAQATYGRRLVRLGAQLCDANGAVIDRDYARAWLPDSVAPSATADVSIDVPAPPQPGHYALKFDLVSEGIDWFERSGSETTLKALHVR